MAHNPRFSNQTNLEICEAERKDLEGEVVHLKVMLKSKNQEIGELKSTLKSSANEMLELKNFLMKQISALSAKLIQNHESPSYHRDVNENPEHQTVTLTNHLDTTTKSSGDEESNVKTDSIPPPEASSSSQPVEKLAATEVNLSHETYESSPSKKAKYECEKCKETFLSAQKLDQHVTTVHGDDSISVPLNTTNTKKNKAKKVQSKKTKLRKPQNQDFSKSPSPVLASRSVRPKKLDTPCPECGKLGRHSLRACKVHEQETRGYSENVDDGDHEGLDEDCKVNFKLRSTSGNGTINGVELDKNMQIRPSVKVGKLLAKFSTKLSVPTDKLMLRCNGRVLEHGEEVRDLAHQTVWLTVVEIKEENNGLMLF